MNQNVRKSLKIKSARPAFPLGVHQVTIDDISDVEETISSNGKPCSTVTLYLRGRVAGIGEIEAEQKVWIVAAPSSLIQQFIRASKVEEDEQGEVDLYDMIGKLVTIEVTKDGNYENITKVLPATTLDDFFDNEGGHR